MNHLSLEATDKELVEFVDRWAMLMELEDYEAAYAYTSHDPSMKWTAALMRSVIKSYDLRKPSQRVTFIGKPTDITQRKEVDRFARNPRGEIAEIWYDLNIDGFTSDLTATFRAVENSDGLEIKLNDIHVM